MAIRTTDSPVNYRAIPPVEEAGVSGGDSDDLYSTRECTSSEALTKWTYFLLGCAILLPFSGDTSCSTTYSSSSHDSAQR